MAVKMTTKPLLVFVGCVVGISLTLLFKELPKNKEIDVKPIVTKDEAKYENMPLGLLKDKILYQGDSVAYERLITRYLLKNGDAPATLPWSLIMANKYKYRTAYFDVFESLTATEPGKGKYYTEHLDTITKALALKYLKAAYDLGDDRALVPYKINYLK